MLGAVLSMHAAEKHCPILLLAPSLRASLLLAQRLAPIDARVAQHEAAALGTVLALRKRPSPTLPARCLELLPARALQRLPVKRRRRRAELRGNRALSPPRAPRLGLGAAAPPSLCSRLPLRPFWLREHHVHPQKSDRGALDANRHARGLEVLPGAELHDGDCAHSAGEVKYSVGELHDCVLFDAKSTPEAHQCLCVCCGSRHAISALQFHLGCEDLCRQPQEEKSRNVGSHCLESYAPLR
eukprot:3870851-Rhodomonas_salina.2